MRILWLSSPLTWLMAAVGLVIGSFLNVCIYRIPEGRFWASARSLCPSCSTPIPAWLNIPLLSFFFLRGKSACCKKPINWQYPLVEILTAALFVGVYWKFPFLEQDKGTWVVAQNECIRFLHAILFSCALFVCSFIDARLKIIPDKISLPMIALTPVVAALHPELTWRSAYLGVLLGGGVIYAVAWTYMLLRRREGIGMGDVKFLAAIGGWLGWQAVLPTLFYASILGSVCGIGAVLLSRKGSLQMELPFGPYLAIGALVHLLFNPHFLYLPV